MRVLHLFSNYKWTGPAEPALILCAGLRECGVEIDFACPARGTGNAACVVERARARGFDPITDLTLPKSRGVTMNATDILRLRGLVRKRGYDLLHCHMANDHSIAVGGAGSSVPVVRSSYFGTGIEEKPKRTAFCLKRTAFLIEPSQLALNYDRERYGMSPDRMAVVPTSIDLERFDPERMPPASRAALGIPEDAFVFGIVARMQRHRFFDVLLEAIRRVSQSHPEVHLVVVGRGTHQEEVAKIPARELGIADRVHFAGYLRDDDFVAAVNTFDMKVFMTPGTDGTCRAVREAMALGKAAIVNSIGMLPELIQHGETGLVFDRSVESLEAALVEAVSNRERVAEMGGAARAHAVSEFDPERQAKRVVDIYRSVLAR